FQQVQIARKRAGPRPCCLGKRRAHAAPGICGRGIPRETLRCRWNPETKKRSSRLLAESAAWSGSPVRPWAQGSNDKSLQTLVQRFEPDRMSSDRGKSKELRV